MKHRIAVGTYTEPAGHVPDARGTGISILEIDDESMESRTLSVTEVVSPSYLVFEKKGGFLYSISESSGESADTSAWHLEENGRLETRQSGTENLSGCHLALSRDNKMLYTASYTSGQMNTYDLADGRIGSLIQSISYSGSGPNKARQEASHAHQVMPNPAGDFVFVCDLGSDTVWKHHLEELALSPTAALKVPPGYGPRHMAIGPRYDIAYILCELIPRILVVSIDRVSGDMEILKELDSTLPEYMKQAAPAAVKVHPSGRSLAVSNRFDDTISVFILGGNTGGKTGADISMAGNFPCRGKTPRDINFSEDGRILFIANQDSHDIQLCCFNKETGFPTGNWGPKIDIGSPACVINLQKKI